MYKYLIKIDLSKIIITGILIRLFFFLFLLFFPYEHSLIGLIGPNQFQTLANDNLFYLNFSDKPEKPPALGYYFEFENFKYNYYNLLKLNFELIDNRYPGFVYPLILYLTNYSKDYPIFLSTIVVLLEILTMILITRYLFQKVNNICSLAYVFLPIPLIFTLFPSSDLFFFTIFIIIYLLFFEDGINSRKNLTLKTILYYILIFLLVFTRPIGILIIIYSLFLNLRFKFNFLISTTFIFLALIYYVPYLILEFRINPENNLSNTSLISFDSLSIVFTKFLHLFGMNPTSSQSNIIYLVKACSAMYLIIGYISSFFNAKIKDIILINLFILPTLIFFGAAWRYIFPIIPFLHLYSFIFIVNIFKIIKFN